MSRFTESLNLYGTIIFLATFALCSSCNKKTINKKGEITSDAAGDFVNNWEEIKPLALNPKIEAQIDELLPKLSVEQKVGQVIQADNASITPEQVKKYRIGSVLSGGNSAPGPLPYADTKTWLAKADEYYNASIDPEGVEVAIPCIWGIDAVHGHANLKGATIFPHNIGLGAMNNPDLIEKIAEVTALELCISGHDWTFAPTLAIPQDLRWGRSYEGYSQDPQIVKAYAERIVKGLQGEKGSDDFMADNRVISCAKHFLADGATDKGIDQGDAKIDINELVNVHAAGYYSAIPAGVQTVMASFSSWQGRKLHGDRELITDVLKDQLGFTGFVVGDWNGHGQVSGCTNTDCAVSFNAGLDMFMAPDSWEELYNSTLAHVQNGVITMERLDDAVRRILRVKIESGIFTKGAPSNRNNAGNENLLGRPESRAIARQAVRESMVLLKNNESILPLNASKTILVVGDGAANISKTCGGWTLSWQGGGHPNEEFPNGQSILDGIKEVVTAAGGKVIFAPDGNSEVKADAVVAVYGEDPYAEFQGDKKDLDFKENEFDVSRLSQFKAKGIPVVSVFLSGRPMWCNPEINLSDAFIAAWLPGSEGGGVSDLLFKTDPSFDFTGSLSFRWPSSAVVTDTQEPLFDLAYGLNYDSKTELKQLSEDSGLNLNEVESTGVFYAKGNSVAPWKILLSSYDMSKEVGSYPTSINGLLVNKTDHQSQEDALRIQWTASESDYLQFTCDMPSDFSRQSNAGLELAFSAKSFKAGPCQVNIGMCDSSHCENLEPITIESGTWKEYRISLSCFDNVGITMSDIVTALRISADKGVDAGINNIRLETDKDAKPGCNGR